MQQPDPHTPESARLLVRNSREEIERAEERLLSALERFGFPEAARFAVRLALEEALVNAFRHGHRHLPDEPVTLEFRIARDELRMSVEDRGPGFNPAGVPDPTLDENLELPTGRGLLLMRAYMTSVEYVGRGNRVEMVYRRPAPG